MTNGSGNNEEEEGPELDPAGLEALLAYLHRTRSFDFSGYKRTTLSRRIQRRIQTVGVKTYGEYVDYLEVHPDEFLQLFNTLLINVTSFYRDPLSWQALREQLAKLLPTREGRGIRVWCAGCASGEEAYTLAIVLCELLGEAELVRRVKIYATDIDEEALTQARLAMYSVKAVEGIPADQLERYFTLNAGMYTFSKDLRRVVIFGRHDLVQDAPISRVDILSCRNTLMYFNAETQSKILNRLNFALVDDGILFLGKAEMLLTHSNLFTPLDLKLRLFKRTRVPRMRDRYPDLVPSQADATLSVEEGGRLQRAAFETAPFAQLVIDGDGRVALVNQRAAMIFSLTVQDVGRPFQDLELSYRPIELRSRIDRVRSDEQPYLLKGVERVAPNGDKTYFDVELAPLQDSRGAVGVQVSFLDVSLVHRLSHDLERSNLELEAAQEELQSTSEELETTNEELQSTVEELETTNEELQSTNEELETMNEELQSTNEELQTMNEELRQRGDSLNQVNAFFGSILASLRSGVAVLDGELCVKAWNERMEDLWGLRTDETLDRHFLSLDIGLPVDELASALRACLATGASDQRELACTNRRGKPIRCRVETSALRGEHSKPGVIVLVDEAASSSS